jgi:hypothetical protein
VPRGGVRWGGAGLTGRQRARGRRRDRGGHGSLMGGPYATVQGGAVESQPLTRGLCNTVQAAVELDLKKKFQIRLKSNGSNGFKF